MASPKAEFSGRRFDDGLRRSLGFRDLIGVDEAGRGPLAGPVVVAAVRVSSRAAGYLSEARDSKLLDAKRREVLFSRIRERADAVAVAWAHPSVIDSRNILAATLECMRRAAQRVSVPKAWTVVDGPFEIPELNIPQLSIIDGDRYSLAVSCASIVAKVVRDRWLDRLDRRHPGYGLAKHKGYGTAEHLAALKRKGPSPAHRLSYAPVAASR